MGIAFRQFQTDANALRDLEAMPDGVMWIVLRADEAGDIHLQGISDTKRAAAAMCRDATYIVAPMPINVLLPERPIEWIGAFRPLA